MNRIVVINECDDCPFFDNVYYEYNEECSVLQRRMELKEYKEGPGWHYPIPNDCPLKVTNEEVSSDEIYK